MPLPDAPQVIAVTGGKGGTGKTAVAVNLAAAAARSGRRVVLMDADLGLANVDVLLGLTPRWTIEHVLRGERSLADVILRTRDGIRVVPAASGVSRLAELDARGHAAVIDAFAGLSADCDLMILDTAAGIGPAVRRFAAAAQHVLVVLRDEPASLTDAYALIKVLSRDHGVERFRIVVNMCREAARARAVFDRLHRVTDRYLEVALEHVGTIPDDPLLLQAVRTRRSVVEAYPDSRAARAMAELADRLARWPVSALPSGRVEFFLERLVAQRSRA